MAYTTIDELFTGICDAVRSKDGTTDLIKHQDIPDKILAIPSGGGGGGLFVEKYDTYIGVNFLSSVTWRIGTGDPHCVSYEYEVKANHTYCIYLGNTIGNRFRAALFDTDVFPSTSEVTGIRTIIDTDSPSSHQGCVFTTTKSGYLVCYVSNESVLGEVFLIDTDSSNVCRITSSVTENTDPFIEITTTINGTATLTSSVEEVS